MLRSLELWICIYIFIQCSSGRVESWKCEAIQILHWMVESSALGPYSSLPSTYADGTGCGDPSLRPFRLGYRKTGARWLGYLDMGMYRRGWIMQTCSSKRCWPEDTDKCLAETKRTEEQGHVVAPESTTASSLISQACRRIPRLNAHRLLEFQSITAGESTFKEAFARLVLIQTRSTFWNVPPCNAISTSARVTALLTVSTRYHTPEDENEQHHSFSTFSLPISNAELSIMS